MTLSVFTNTQIISLEDGAADMFTNYVLSPDEKMQVQPVQTYEQKMMNKAINLQLRNGIDEVNKKMILAGLADLKEGERFLCNGAKITDIESTEALYYMRIVRHLNNGENLTPTQAQARARIDETEVIVQLKKEDEN